MAKMWHSQVALLVSAQLQDNTSVAKPTPYNTIRNNDNSSSNNNNNSNNTNNNDDDDDE